MFIEVTRTHAVAALAAGETLWCQDTGEGWELCDPTRWSKRAIRRFVARHYRDARYWCGKNQIKFMINRGE